MFWLLEYGIRDEEEDALSELEEPGLRLLDEKGWGISELDELETRVELEDSIVLEEFGKTSDELGEIALDEEKGALGPDELAIGLVLSLEDPVGFDSEQLLSIAMRIEQAAITNN